MVARWCGRSGADYEQSSCERGRERGRYETLHGLLPPIVVRSTGIYAASGNADWHFRGYNSAVFLHYWV